MGSSAWLNASGPFGSYQRFHQRAIHPPGLSADSTFSIPDLRVDPVERRGRHDEVDRALRQHRLLERAHRDRERLPAVLGHEVPASGGAGLDRVNVAPRRSSSAVAWPVPGPISITCALGRGRIAPKDLEHTAGYPGRPAA